MQAVWIEHKLRFTYFGRTTFYSCDGLRDKVRYLLHQVGARRDDLSVVMACFDNTGPQDLPGVRIRAHLPAEATPALLAKLEEDEPRRTLIARVQGKGKDLDAATAQFPASWRTVEIEGRRNRHIEDGDCELIEQMIDDVLVPLGVRVAADSRVHCSANQVQIGSVKLKVESLQRLPEPDVAAPPAGASGPGETGDKVPVIPDTGAVETATQH